MAASTITRVAWTDGAAGTVINNARKNSDIYDKIDQMFAGVGAYATLELGGSLQLDGGVLTFVGLGSAPGVSGASNLRMYYDTSLGFVASANAGPYVPIGTPPYQAPSIICRHRDVVRN
jgi:hypothetical protein